MLSRYGQQTGGVIDNCQLSDWPVRDMDKGRHLIPDDAFEVYERASYGHGCEIQPIADEKHKKCKYIFQNFKIALDLLHNKIFNRLNPNRLLPRIRITSKIDDRSREKGDLSCNRIGM